MAKINSPSQKKCQEIFLRKKRRLFQKAQEFFYSTHKQLFNSANEMDLELPFSFFSTLKRVYKLSHNTITSTTTMIIIITYGLATRSKNDWSFDKIIQIFSLKAFSFSIWSNAQWAVFLFLTTLHVPLWYEKSTLRATTTTIRIRLIKVTPSNTTAATAVSFGAPRLTERPRESQ